MRLLTVPRAIAAVVAALVIGYGVAAKLERKPNTPPREPWEVRVAVDGRESFPAMALSNQPPGDQTIELLLSVIAPDEKWSPALEKSAVPRVSVHRLPSDPAGPTSPVPHRVDLLPVPGRDDLRRLRISARQDEPGTVAFVVCDYWQAQALVDTHSSVYRISWKPCEERSLYVRTVGSCLQPVLNSQVVEPPFSHEAWEGARRGHPPSTDETRAALQAEQAWTVEFSEPLPQGLGPTVAAWAWDGRRRHEPPVQLQLRAEGRFLYITKPAGTVLDAEAAVLDALPGLDLPVSLPSRFDCRRQPARLLVDVATGDLRETVTRYGARYFRPDLAALGDHGLLVRWEDHRLPLVVAAAEAVTPATR